MQAESLELNLHIPNTVLQLSRQLDRDNLLTLVHALTSKASMLILSMSIRALRLACLSSFNTNFYSLESLRSPRFLTLGEEFETESSSSSLLSLISWLRKLSC